MEPPAWLCHLDDGDWTSRCRYKIDLISHCLDLCRLTPYAHFALSNRIYPSLIASRHHNTAGRQTQNHKLNWRRGLVMLELALDLVLVAVWEGALLGGSDPHTGACWVMLEKMGCL